MTSQSIFIITIIVVSLALLGINLAFATHNPYSEKDSTFECGFHSFLGQNRSEFNISFFLFALLFLLFDLEILLVYPFVITAYTNESFGMIFFYIFFILLTLGFVYEIGKKALSIQSKQTTQDPNNR